MDHILLNMILVAQMESYSTKKNIQWLFILVS